MSTHTDRQPSGLPTVRDLLAPIFRHKRAGILVALSVFTAATVATVLSPGRYEAELKLLVRRERADPIVSADPNAGPQARMEVSEDELNSEVEVLKGRDLLAQVASASGLLAEADASPSGDDKQQPDPLAVARAVRSLEKSLRITPIRKSTLIVVTYRSRDPVLAARVLTELSRLYLEKHIALHRPTGAYRFFSEQAEHFRAELNAADAALQAYGRNEHVIAPELEKETTLRQRAEFEATLQQTRTQIADAGRRLAELETLSASTPERQTTQIRTADHAALTAALKSRILELEMKRAEMVQKFTPTYAPLVELESQLTKAREALRLDEQSPVTEQTTDHNPTHQWLQSELARVRTERAAAVARAATIEQSVRAYDDKARRLDQMSAAQQELRRARKTAEDNYLLYLKKQEEARISDALDRTRIANVAVAEAPTVPALPSNSEKSWIVLLGALVALVLGTATTYVLDYVSPYFRTPDEVERTLDLPVLATLAARQ